MAKVATTVLLTHYKCPKQPTLEGCNQTMELVEEQARDEDNAIYLYRCPLCGVVVQLYVATNIQE